MYAVASTRAEVDRLLEEAIPSHLEALEEDGAAVPPPHGARAAADRPGAKPPVEQAPFAA